ncbi:MAG TPA: carboxymuconolactone decarboxylase family protein, partial [Dehalococcoidia bacterium]|nr:carboxymuconolactone decarboxylase family protein [Dehalococcoidia bacterium]
MTAIVSLVEEPDSDELRELYERLALGMPELGVLNIFKAMAHNPQLLRGWLRMATPLLAGGLTLSPRLREIAILRVAQVCGSEYEFAHHIRIAQQAGLSEEEIASLQNYDEGERFSELDRAVVRYTNAVANLSAEAPELAREMKRWLSDGEL